MICNKLASLTSKYRNMGITVAVILLVIFIANAFNQTFSVEIQSKGLEFKAGCSTTTSIICEQELTIVQIGVCFT